MFLQAGVVKKLSGHGHADGEAMVEKSEPPDEEYEDTNPPRLESGLGLAGEHELELSPTFVNNVAPPLEKDFGTLVISEEGSSRYVNHNFWARVTEEVYMPGLIPFRQSC